METCRGVPDITSEVIGTPQRERARAEKMMNRCSRRNVTEDVKVQEERELLNLQEVIPYVKINYINTANQAEQGGDWTTLEADRSFAT